MIEIFKAYVLGKTRLTESDFERIAAVSQLKKLRKKQYLLQEGDVWKYNAFVTKGCLRTYTLDEKGNEHIINFAIENWWIGDRESLMSGEPSLFNIDALEDAEVILISRSNFDQICKDLPEFNDLINGILQKSFIAAQNRIHTFISLSAEDKYLKFLERYPQLSARVSQAMIASYLGLTPETLSRLRKQTLKK